MRTPWRLTLAGPPVSWKLLMMLVMSECALPPQPERIAEAEELWLPKQQLQDHKALLSDVQLDGSQGRSLDLSLHGALKQTAKHIHAKYDCAVALAFFSPAKNIVVADGYTDRGLGLGRATRKTQPDDLFVWGSTTKMYTAPAVLQLVDAGKAKLEAPVTEYLDDSVATAVRKHIPRIDSVLLGHALHMTSGLADYDGEAYSAAQFSRRAHDFAPLEILLNYVNSSLQFTPGSQQRYSSTNYILLGLVLAHFAGSPSWMDFNQLSVIPAERRFMYNFTRFVRSGTCSQHTPVHGFLEGYSTASIPKQDVWNVSCLGGWTAGNLLATVSDVARFTYDLYRPGGGIISAASLQRMVDFANPVSGGPGRHFKFYGMGTFELGWSAGIENAVGHVGDTYGYQSQTTYFPNSDFVISVSTNVETKSQAQPAEATCLAYHAVVAAIAGRAPPACNFTVPRRFIGTCVCTPRSQAA
mmetsp:Transcript_1694/g.3252  ORF Transcript_1694/g.3252 Transcript_1694/m.3252 type:complete len:469 (+) Transcript_1694:76-1482(+)